MSESDSAPSTQSGSKISATTSANVTSAVQGEGIQVHIELGALESIPPSIGETTSEMQEIDEEILKRLDERLSLLSALQLSLEESDDFLKRGQAGKDEEGEFYSKILLKSEMYRTAEVSNAYQGGSSDEKFKLEAAATTARSNCLKAVAPKTEA